jgi:hypothetical protein
MSLDLSNRNDIIDSRDVIARIEELTDERTALADALKEAREAHEAIPDPDLPPEIPQEEQQAMLADAVDLAAEDLKEWDESSDAEELKALLALQEEAEGYASDWQYGCALIRDSHFEEYAEELVKDIGDLPRELPGYIEIDWKKTAENIQVDYTSVDFDGVTYWVR